MQSAEKLQQEKKLSVDEEKSIYRILKKQSSHLDVPTLLFLRATVITGRRPIEWPTTEFIKDYVDEEGVSHGITLKVINAKSTILRSHGKYRHLILSSLSKDDI